MLSMQTLLEKMIRYDSDGPILDFKEMQYPVESGKRKNEMLKDISAMANYPGDEDKFIIVGVVEQNGMASTFRDIENLVDEAYYQQFVLSNIEPKINFEYKRFYYQGKSLAYFRIFNNVNRPYLFKKELIDKSLPHRVEYKVGDGFIRHGSTTRKMVRDDFETIYQNRFTHKDRKGDVTVIPSLRKCENDELTELRLQCIDIEIKNNSNKSLNLDAEKRIYKSKAFDIVSENTLLRKLEEERNELRKYNTAFGSYISSVPAISFDVSICYEETSVIVSRNKRIGEITALS